jgi:hypothetical protein
MMTRFSSSGSTPTTRLYSLCVPKSSSSDSKRMPAACRFVHDPVSSSKRERLRNARFAGFAIRTQRAPGRAGLTAIVVRPIAGEVPNEFEMRVQVAPRSMER